MILNKYHIKHLYGGVNVYVTIYNSKKKKECELSLPIKIEILSRSNIINRHYNLI